jgi:hypothetical protein
MRLRSGYCSYPWPVAALFLALALPLPAAAQVPSADEVLRDVGFSSSDQQQVMGGAFVTTTLKPTSDRELAVAMAFLVNAPPSDLIEDARRDVLLHTDPNTLAFGKIHEQESAHDFGGVPLTPDAKKRAQAYLDAKPGEALNLSAAEIKAFQALKAENAGQSCALEQVRKTLLGRYQAYRAKGIDGIADYARGGGKTTPAGGDLRRASEAAKELKKYLPAFYDVLNGYPKVRPAGFDERFDWSNYEAHGTPIFVLTHRFSMPDGDAYVLAQRQYYVSRGHNVLQALAGFIPVEQGTVVVYVNRTSTEQVSGFGGGAKRKIGSRVMASQLRSLYAKVRAEVEK